MNTTKKTPPPPAADPTKLAQVLSEKRRGRHLTVLAGCLLVSFLCGSVFVIGILGTLAIARTLGWQ
ncbi:MAG TPA: hypothetical protein VGH28_10490 [Polyangiaceae bacterium]|jgi:hypothetical protein